jgi:hypothetical protein
MEGRKLSWLPGLAPLVFGVALVALILDAGSGPSWGASSAHVVLAARFEHVAASPLYDLLAGTFTTLVPAGEPGFRLALLGALLGACTLAGVVAAARALLPKDPAAGVIAALLLLLAPPFREATAFAAPSVLAATGVVWGLAFALRFARTDARAIIDARDAICALAACGLVIGAAPWLGALVTLAITVWLARAGARRDMLALAIAALGLAVVALWFDAAGALPGASSHMGIGLLAAGRGSAAIVLGAGLIGAAFGALTSLPRARGVFALLGVALAHEVVFGGAASALLAIAAVGLAILPSAVVRVAASPSVDRASDRFKRHALAVAAGVPLVGVAAATGATLTIDDPGSSPRELASDLIDAIPPGTGIFVATRAPSWLAIHHEMVVAGARPDLALVPPLPANQADAIVANALRASHIVGSDAASFGRLDITRASPQLRGFQLRGDAAPPPAIVLPPPRYASAIGREQATLVALERARYEAANGRLDAAARAAGLERRFGAADLAILATTSPTRDRPALFGLLPRELIGTDVGSWLLDLFGDDLAWVGGIAIPDLPANAPPARRLHAKWRAILSGTATPNDPDIAPLGPAAVKATRELFVETKPPEPTMAEPSEPATPDAGAR